jgi:hypothetical protein
LRHALPQGNAPASKELGPLSRCFMRKRTPDEWHNWCLARERIDKELREYYRACITRELPPQLLALAKKLDEELPKSKTAQSCAQAPYR